MGIWLVLGLFILCLTACSTQEEVSTAQTTQPEVESTFSPNLGSITSNGTVLPVRRMALSFGMGGFVEVVDVQIGGFVKAGQTLARLDTIEAQLAIHRAELLRRLISASSLLGFRQRSRLQSRLPHSS
jgi:multidrug efflux pump subunit AcrA (membrane-fusion protein)